MYVYGEATTALLQIGAFNMRVVKDARHVQYTTRQKEQQERSNALYIT